MYRYMYACSKYLFCKCAYECIMSPLFFSSIRQWSQSPLKGSQFSTLFQKKCPHAGWCSLAARLFTLDNMHLIWIFILVALVSCTVAAQKKNVLFIIGENLVLSLRSGRILDVRFSFSWWRRFRNASLQQQRLQDSASEQFGQEKFGFQELVCVSEQLLAKQVIIMLILLSERFWKDDKKHLCVFCRSTVLTGLPNHQNGMYGLHQDIQHYNSFDAVKSLPLILKDHNIRTGRSTIHETSDGCLWGIFDIVMIFFRYYWKEARRAWVGVPVRLRTHRRKLGRAPSRPQHHTHQAPRSEVPTEQRLQVRFLLLIKDYLVSYDLLLSFRPFFLYIGFHDPHRNSGSPQFGAFCEKFGSGEPGMGVIPDWKPEYYSPDDVIVPDFVQDTPAVREDIAKQYTTISRLDQG